MRRTDTHQHYCCNRAKGCQTSYECKDNNLESNYEGRPDPVCGLNPSDELECPDCDSSRCSECGRTLNVESHELDCEKATAV